MDLSSRFSRVRRRMLLAGATLSVSGFAQSPQPAEGPVQALLRSHKKWLFAHTSRQPLDPLEVWNQYPAAFDMDGDRVRLTIVPTFHDGATFSLDIQAGGFTLDWTGHGVFFMRLDTADPKAPFKGQAGVMTLWLLPAE